MKRNFVLTQEDFDNLLNWLSPDREVAGEVYEKVRDGLMRFFRFRGCPVPEELTDETINRVATKVSTFEPEKKVKTITYFYGFAANIYREYLSRKRNKEVQLEEDSYFEAKVPAGGGEPEDARLECLDDCLETLAPDEKELIVTYYSKEKKEKTRLRTEIAKKMNLNVSTLYLRVHRIKLVLRDCVENCQKERTS